jgi:hypothetical protein
LKLRRIGTSVEDTALVGGDHVFNVYEGIFPSVDLKQLESLLDQVSQVLTLSLRIVNLISQVLVSNFEEVHNWEDLSVVGH